MTDDTSRGLLLAGLLAGLAIGGYHRWQAHAKGGQVSRAEEGRAMFLALRLCGGLGGLIVTLAWLIHPPWLSWLALPLPAAARWSGAALGLLTLAWTWWTMHTLGTNLTDTVATRANHTLVTHGPYRWVRHPFYCMVLLAMTAATLLTANAFFVLAGTVIFTLLAIRSGREEEKLVERFGDEYRDYQRRTGRFWPRIGW